MNYCKPHTFGQGIWLSKLDIDGAQRIYGKPGPTAILYSGKDFTGDHIVIGPTSGSAVPSLRAVGFNDRASSILLFGTTVVSVFRDGGYQSTCQSIRGDDIPGSGLVGAKDLSGTLIGDNTISSIVVGASCQPQVVLYQHANYGGAARSFRGSIANLKSYGFNDKASSLKLTDGATVVALFKDPSYSGKCTTVRSDSSRLSALMDNDSVSSLRVGTACPATQVTLYKDSSFRGSSRDLTADVPNLKDVGFNDEVTAIRIHGSFPIAVYRDPDFRGACRTIRGHVGNVGKDWNDKISSLRIGRTCEGGSQ
jgi:hypothetical protein